MSLRGLCLVSTTALLVLLSTGLSFGAAMHAGLKPAAALAR